ncbi:MAG: LysM peptidoglycan-binding domain-containing protein [Candidatus Limnocylindrales bacterium]
MAIAGPRVLSRQQQELVCLKAAHVDCPRYRRATAGGSSTVRGRIRIPAMPRATAAALVVLALSAGVSLGFVLQRGGIDLPSAAVSSGAAAVASGVIGSPSTGPSAAAATPDVSPLPTSLASSAASPSSPPATPAVSATPAPTATRSPEPKPTPTSTASGGVPSADRLAVIKPCPGQAGCWIYKVRSGDNLWSIAHWFGVPLDTIYAWNPSVKQAGIQPGTPLKIPTPTR